MYRCVSKNLCACTEGTSGRGGGIGILYMLVQPVCFPSPSAVMGLHGQGTLGRNGQLYWKEKSP